MREIRSIVNISLVFVVISLGAFSQEVNAIQIGPKLPKCGGFICDTVEKVKNKTIKAPFERVLEDTEKLLQKLGKGFCNGPYRSITQPIVAACANYHRRMDKRTLIKKAKDLLIDKGYFTESDFSNVKIRWCPLVGDTAGMVPDRNKLLIDVSYMDDSPRDIAPVIAHEMVHVHQYIKLGTEKFKCQYTEKFLRCGGCQDGKHSLEKEAYDFEEKVRNNLDR